MDPEPIMVTPGMNCITNLNSNNITASVNHAIGSDDLSEDSSSSDSPSFDDTDLLSSGGVNDDITSQLMAAGPVGVAAAAAIATGKKRRKHHLFEINPSTRRRQQTRLLRKIKATIDEYTTRIGQQALLLLVTPGKPQNNFKVFGAHPLENVVRNCRSLIMHELEAELANQAPTQVAQEDSTLHELPHLVIDGIPTPVEKMTQAQLRAFIPLMLKYSTGRGKPGWGKEGTKPAWWPSDLPWANVRSDVRSEEDKQRVSWTHALRQIVINCYKHHGREDLLPVFNESEEKDKNNTMTHLRNAQPTTNVVDMETLNAGQEAMFAQPLAAHYAPTVLQTINNPDGSVSIIQVDPNTLLTLPEGMQTDGGPMRMLSLQYVREEFEEVDSKKGIRIQNAQNDAPQVHTLGEVAAVSQQESEGGGSTSHGTVNINLNGDSAAHAVATLAEATLSHDGQIILTGEDGTQSTFPVSGMVTIPVSMYQTVVDISNLSDVQASGMQVLEPVITEVRSENNDNSSRNLEVLSSNVSTGNEHS